MENNKIDDGGSAFPLAGSSDYSYEPQVGMSLRDWFAAEIMPAIYTKYFDQDSESGIAIAAYRMADAMLAARQHHPQDPVVAVTKQRDELKAAMQIIASDGKDQFCWSPTKAVALAQETLKKLTTEQ